MSFSVVTIPPFDKQLKRLAKKYPSLRADFSALIEELQIIPDMGVPIGNNCYKIRVAIGKDKSGGARLITYVQYVGKSVFLLSVFDKSDQENITDAELNMLLKLMP